MAMNRRSWNNVLIFAVAAMILLFHMTGRRVPSDTAQTGRLLPPDAVVLALELDSFRMERRGTGWISNVPMLAPEQLETMIQGWRQAQGPLLGSAWPEVSASELRIWLADEAGERRYRLYYSSSQLLVQSPDGGVIELEVSLVPVLLPMEVL